jgi:hypothetical protein
MLDMKTARRTQWKKDVQKPTGGNRETGAAARIVAGMTAGLDRLTKNDEVARIDAAERGEVALTVGKRSSPPTKADLRFRPQPERRV